MGCPKVQVRRRFLLLLAIVFVSFLAFSVTSTLKKRAVTPTATILNNAADVRVRSFSFVHTGKENTSWTLRATEAELFEDTQFAYLKDITASMPYGEAGQILIEGDRGKIASDKKNFSIEKDSGFMTIQLQDRYFVETAGLKWDENQRTLSSQGSVHISGLETDIYGNKLAISVDQEEMTVIGDVKALFY